MITTSVESISSLYFLIPFSFGSHGQEAFCSSDFHFAERSFSFCAIIGELRFEAADPAASEQGRRDSNPQPAVLETATLPIELLPYCSDLSSFRKC